MKIGKASVHNRSLESGLTLVDLTVTIIILGMMTFMGVFMFSAFSSMSGKSTNTAQTMAEDLKKIVNENLTKYPTVSNISAEVSEDSKLVIMFDDTEISTDYGPKSNRNWDITIQGDWKSYEIKVDPKNVSPSDEDNSDEKSDDSGYADEKTEVE